MGHRFTLVELAVIVVIVVVLSMALFPRPVNERERRSAKTVCINHLKQICLGTIMYAGDNNDRLPLVNATPGADVWTDYRTQVQNYFGKFPSGDMFACPADKYYYSNRWADSYVAQGSYLQAQFHFTSYGFNAGNVADAVTNRYPGIAGWHMSVIYNPQQTLLAGEMSAWKPFSWHKPVKLPQHAEGVADAMNNMSFVDGHAQYVKTYWDARTPDREAWAYDPPEEADYAYKRRGN